MAFPTQVLSDIVTAKEYCSKLNEGFIADLKRGCDNCTPKQGYCLMGLLTSLEYKASVGVYDKESQSLYLQMMEIIGGEAYVPVSDARIYFGSTETNEALTSEDIITFPFVEYTINQDIVIPFEVDYEFPFIALTFGVPIPNKIENLSNGIIEDIGANGQLLGVPYQVGQYNVMQGSYLALLMNNYRLFNG